MSFIEETILDAVNQIRSDYETNTKIKTHETKSKNGIKVLKQATKTMTTFLVDEDSQLGAKRGVVGLLYILIKAA